MFRNIRKDTQCRPIRPEPTPRDGARGCPLRPGIPQAAHAQVQARPLGGRRSTRGPARPPRRQEGCLG